MIDDIQKINSIDLIHEMNRRGGLRWVKTVDLMNELKYRNGVEYIMVDPESQCEVVVDNEYNVNVYDARRKGPEIV
jgi:hypothetical protein